MTKLSILAAIASLALLGTACESDHLLDPGVEPPSADAGPDQFIIDRDGDGWETVVLDGAASMPGDHPSGLGFRWDEDGNSLWGVTFDSGRTFYADFTVGSHLVRLTVQDGAGRQSVDFVAVDVAAP
jgi:hypothetical protein